MTVIPIIAMALGTVPKNLENTPDEPDIRVNNKRSSDVGGDVVTDRHMISSMIRYSH